MIALDAQQWFDQLAWQQSISGLESWSARLGERASVDNVPILGIEALYARQLVAFVTQFAISGVFEVQDALPFRITPNDFHQMATPFDRESQPGRVLEIVDRVDQLHT